LGFTERQIAIKTSDKNDLNAPENIDLLSPLCEVRAIVTKQALQEGWDCPSPMCCVHWQRAATCPP
jgi:type III restriction enzyme